MKYLADRKNWMSLLAKAPSSTLAAAFSNVIEELGLTPDFKWLRKPEIGGVMVQGRAGGKGDAFNLGEMTVTRCSLKLENGVVGHAYVQGRDKVKAEQAALIDAYMQSDKATVFADIVLKPILDELSGIGAKRNQRASKTKVDFFTLVRGEDQ
ncbi:phosphonate C-P lyase system protein PhnG [Lentilitoribacter sp. EG35]|uniref:phosphonate C-P lyase system protein PhnG n=2 Tax=unclassified Lentilitoribacter TaxID=2647570 RepID=UPI0013A6A7AA|nr:phosphonate C-P lyase system protein PhnG [Lentilitoribacter sp. Alg239-R112]